MILPPKSKQIRVLADGDSFYASCEVARSPELRWKIVIVQRLDICLAVTYPWKALWLWLATPMRQVKRMMKGKEHYIFDADMGYYERVSNTVFWIIAKHSNCREQFSVDESFYNWTGLVADTDEAVESYAKQLQEYILQATWMPVSFWYARTRLVAKMFNKFKKPFWIYGHLDYESTYNALRSLELQSVPFIGKKRAKRIAYCHTVWDFMNQSGEKIKQELHRDGLKLRLELHGYSALKILRKWWPACIGRSRSFHPHFTQCKKTLWKKLMMNFEKAYAQMICENVATRCVAIRFRDKDFQYYTSKRRLKDHTCERNELIAMMKIMFEGTFRQWVRWRTTCIYFSELVPIQNRQDSLFEFDQERRKREQEQRKVLQTIEAINHKLWGIHITTWVNKEAILKQNNDRDFEKMKVG